MRNLSSKSCLFFILVEFTQFTPQFTLNNIYKRIMNYEFLCFELNINLGIE